MKNKNVVIALIVALLLIVFGVGAYFLSQNKTSLPTSQKAEVTPVQTNNSAEQTLKDLLASKNPVKCTYSTDAGGAKISGTVYVSGGKVRGDFTTTAGATKITGHMATDAKYVYTWTEGSKQGYKFAIDTTAQSKTETGQKPDFNQKFNYSCSPWTLDSKMLELPADVTFTTFNIPSSAPTGSAGISVNNQAACQACAGLPEGESKTACLTQLKCN